MDKIELQKLMQYIGELYTQDRIKTDAIIGLETKIKELQKEEPIASNKENHAKRAGN